LATFNVRRQYVASFAAANTIDTQKLLQEWKRQGLNRQTACYVKTKGRWKMEDERPMAVTWPTWHAGVHTATPASCLLGAFVKTKKNV
jgi:hypothetical protein